MSIKVLHHGLMTTIQDLGRPGYFHLGIPMSGAMDRYALRVANMLVGNDEGAACLEAVFMGPRLEFTQDTIIAITGGEMPVYIDDVLCPTWTALKIQAGQVLRFDFLKEGARIYIAVAGGIDVPLVLNSRSTYVIGTLGGLDGRPVKIGDILPLGQNHGSLKEGKTLSLHQRRPIEKETLLRVLPGLYWDRLTDQAKGNFFEDIWKVTPEADRMGYRFNGGRPLSFVERKQPFGAGSDPSNIVDACYPYGSIQVPSGTEPIILHRDAVSAGGYLMLGTVISADMDIIGQLPPHAKVHFIKVDMKEALQARKERQHMLEKARHFLN